MADKLVKIKTDKTNDLVYKTLFCQVCGSELCRTIENSRSLYLTPVFIIHCRDCKAKHSLKYVEEGIELTFMSIQNKPKGIY